MEPTTQNPPSEAIMTMWSFLVVYGIWVALLFLIILLFVSLLVWRRPKPRENMS